MKRILVLFLLFQIQSLLSSRPLNAQTAVLEDIREEFYQYTSQALQEKIFVHTDRSFYLAGETMWFKVYVVEGGEHKPLDLSKVVYVEVLDKKNKPVAQAKIAMEKGSGNGSFYLPLSLNSGNYKLRAYTNWMKNFGTDFYFDKEISFVNTFLNPEFDLESTQKLPEFDLQFFPEGGDLVRGNRSKVGYKMVNGQGKSIDLEGVVVNGMGDTLALLNPLKFGMGHFYLIPEPNTSYQAIVRTGSDSTTTTFKLPVVRNQGYTMHVEDAGMENIEVTVSGTFADQPVFLFVHSRQEIRVAEAKKTNAGKATFTINKERLKEGISHFTLLNQDKRPVAERLFFKYPEEVLQINAETDQQEYSSRQKVRVKISMPELAKKAANANLSMAVYRLDSLISQRQENIQNYLWLSSELKGTIESPSYYFENRNKETAEAMDNLLLTQGWRRFPWQEVLTKEKRKFSFIPEYEGHLIQALVTDKNSGSPVNNVGTYLSAPGKLVQFYASNSNEKGELRFVTEQLYGKKEILLQNYPQRGDLNIKIQDPFSAVFSDFAVAPFALSENRKETLRDHHIYMQAQNTYWQEERNRLLAPELDSVAFFGAPDQTYLLDNYTRFPTMEDVMREYVYEVRVRKQKGKFVFKVFNPVFEVFFQTDPLVLLDGVLVGDNDKIMAYNPLKVEKLEIVKERFFLGRDIAFEGILSYTTYRGEMEGFPLDPDLTKLDYEGLQLQREFYSPRDNHSTRKPDFRTLLHWEPEITLKGNGQTELSFYTSDLKGKFMIDIQGISEEGQAGVETLFFEVKEGSL